MPTPPRDSSPHTPRAAAPAQDGFLSLYTGLSAGLVRQATYTTARLGIFRTLSNYMAGGFAAALRCAALRWPAARAHACELRRP